MMQKKWYVIIIAIILSVSVTSVWAQTKNPDKKTTPNFTQTPDKDDAQKGQYKERSSVGTVTLTMQGGVQSITNSLYNPNTLERRDIIIDDYGAIYYTIILSLRFGTHVEGWENINDGFRYNRSNKGFFTDFEFGLKTYNFGTAGESFAYYPSTFTITHTGGKNTLTDKNGNIISSQQIVLGERTKVGDNTVSILPWQIVLADQVIDDPTKYADNDLYHILGIDTTNANTRKMLESHGVAATKSSTIFINSYYHFNFFHWLFGLVGLNLGTVFDSSIGLSFRLNHYVDITDFNRFVSYNNDGYTGNIGVIMRNYINFGKKLRTKISYMFPVVGFFANRVENKDINAEEHIAELAIEYYAISYIYFSAGIIYSHYPFNQKHPDSVIRVAPTGGDAEIIPGVREQGRGIVFSPGQYNAGFNQELRSALEIYFAVSLDINL